MLSQDLTLRKVALLKAERALEQYKVLAVIGQHMGYSKGRPVAALLAHRWVSGALIPPSCDV